MRFGTGVLFLSVFLILGCVARDPEVERRQAIERANAADRHTLEWFRGQPNLLCIEVECGADQIELISEAKAAVADKLRDPASARFREIHMTSGRRDFGTAVCGRVQGRNGFGGYGQPLRFTFSRGAGAQIDPFYEHCDVDPDADRKIKEALARIAERGG